jgi:hypothetical protein
VDEAEWLACQDLGKMLEFLRGKASGRKLRQFAVACCRAVWELLTDERSRAAVEGSERYADGLASKEELRALQRPAAAAARQFAAREAAEVRRLAESYTPSDTRYGRSWPIHILPSDGRIAAEAARQVALLSTGKVMEGAAVLWGGPHARSRGAG